MDIVHTKEMYLKTQGTDLRAPDYKDIMRLNNEKPTVIIAHTIKGKGVSFMEDKLEWHYKTPSREEYELALKELNI